MRLTKRVKGHLAFSVLLKVSCLHGELVVVIIPDLKGALQRAVALFNANVPLNSVSLSRLTNRNDNN